MFKRELALWCVFAGVDMQAEQNILTERVYGEIRNYCRHNYAVDFHVSACAMAFLTID